MSEETKHKSGFMSDGHLDENSIAACAEWLSGVSEEPDKILQDHLEYCEQCKQAVLDISELRSQEGSVSDSSHTQRDSFEETCAGRNSPTIKFRPGNQFWRVAAVIFILVTVTAISLLIGPKEEQEIVDNVEPLDSIEIQADDLQEDQPGTILDTNLQEENNKPIGIESVQDNRYAENFTVNSNYEALIGVQFRAGRYPEIIYPGSDTVMYQNMALSFIGKNPDLDVLEIQILNNKAVLVKDFSGLDTINLEVNMDLDPGLYYWKLLGEDELIEVGKIRVEERK